MLPPSQMESRGEETVCRLCVFILFFFNFQVCNSQQTKEVLWYENKVFIGVFELDDETRDGAVNFGTLSLYKFS